MSLRTNVQQVQITGTEPTFAAVDAGAGDTFYPEPGVAFEVKNSGGSPGNVTIEVPGTAYGQARPDVVRAVPATTGHVRFGGLVPDLADPVTGLIRATYSGGTLTCALVRN